MEGDSERSGEGGLLGFLITDTNAKDAIRRKREKLRSAERARRSFASSPAAWNHKEPDESPKQQTPRQPTGEAPAKVRAVPKRSKTMPESSGGAPPGKPLQGTPPPTTKIFDRSGREDR